MPYEYDGKNVVHIFRVPSESRPGIEYHVTLWTNERFTCTCKSFLMGKQQRGLSVWERTCKHITWVEENRKTYKEMDQEKVIDELQPVTGSTTVDPRIISLVEQTLKRLQ